MSKWILREEQLPELGIDVLLYCDYETMFIGSLCEYPKGDYFWAGIECGPKFKEVTHWMSLPTAPE